MTKKKLKDGKKRRFFHTSLFFPPKMTFHFYFFYTKRALFISLVTLLIMSVTGLWAVTGGAIMTTTDEFVAIDGHVSGYTIFMRVSKENLAKIQVSEGQVKIDSEPWKEFQTDLAKYVQRCIIKNEYPEYSASAIEKGLLAFLNNFPGMPIGLTWNGGVAITYGDYEFAKNGINKYRENKVQYENARNTDTKADPLNPRAHFEALLGNSFLDR